MTAHSRRALRATATLAGVVALGTALSGTAYAADGWSGAAQDNRLHNDAGAEGSGPAALGTPLDGADLLAFALPTAGPSLAPTKKNDDDPPGGGSKPNHYHPGADEPPYDFDLYSPTETYGPNYCHDKGADRAPITAFGNSSLPGYNGSAKRDCKVDSGDYHPKRTGYQGTDRGGDGGYSGYLGSDPERQADNDYLFKFPGF